MGAVIIAFGLLVLIVLSFIFLYYGSHYVNRHEILYLFLSGFFSLAIGFLIIYAGYTYKETYQIVSQTVYTSSNIAAAAQVKIDFEMNSNVYTILLPLKQRATYCHDDKISLSLKDRTSFLWGKVEKIKCS